MSGDRERYKVECDDGWTLDVLHIPAVGEAKGSVVLGHAMMVDRRSLDRPQGAGFGTAMAEAGWNVHLPNLRGRGDSGPDVDAGGSWSYDDIIRFDLPACVAAARKLKPGPVWVVGHSLAGHASIAAAGAGFYEDAPPDGHVLLSSNMWTPDLEPRWWLRRRKATSVLLFAGILKLFGKFPSRGFGMGPVDEAGSYVSDIVRIWKGNAWASRDGEHDYFEGMKRVTGPVLAVVGKGDDLMAHPSGARAWTDGFGEGRADWWLVGEGDHGLPFDPDHMTVVTDDRSRPLWNTILGWMSEHA
ncbi:MAG: alpha/beta fold hydrolase [Proteobacteria bacterium]|nr:alpha/beta fold hydrolase [Pseudomonadota bacterium]